MADQRISELTAVVTPAPTDELAVNQGGTSKKMTRAQVHALEVGENLVIPQEDAPTDPTIKFGDGDSGFYEGADDDIRLALAAALVWGWTAGFFTAANAAGPALANEAASATNPTLLPNKADADTGIGSQALDAVSLIAGALESVRAEDPADLAAGETSLWLYDLDDAALLQVVVGAADSGGTGYRLLRIPNVTP